MRITSRLCISVVGGALLFACTSEAPKAASDARPSTDTTATTVAERAEKPVTVSPQVAALLAPDPDLEVTLSKEEIRATLEAAQQSAPRPVLSGPTATASPDEWQKMEKDQKKKNEQWKAYLENTLVASLDGSYHSRSCSSLIRRYIDNRNRERTAYVGVDITLQTALDQRLSRHAGCGAPSYEQHY